MNDAVILEPKQPQTASIIWLHGLGADGHDFAPIVPQLKLANAETIRFIFPNAPNIPVTLNGGMTMPAWFDIPSALKLDLEPDLPRIQASVKRIHSLIDAEISRGIDCEHIVLAGFSQGGSVALLAALQYPKPIGGVMLLSSFLPSYSFTHKTNWQGHTDMPIFIAHGTGDPIVPIEMGEYTLNQLREGGYNVQWHTYPMPHSVCAEEVRDISGFLQQVGL